tara:strand:+ start:2385 stop:3647 length:1263 start_codon:yes stop_codon:yes gene_type:complete
MLAAGGGAAANLDLVPTFANRVSGGADAAQSTASNQPVAHAPLGSGHLHLPAVTGNYAELAAGVDLGTQTEILIGVKVRTWSPSDSQALFDQYPASLMVWLRSTGKLQLYFGTSANIQTATGIPASAPLETVIKIVRDGTDASTEVFYKDHDGSFTSLGSATLGAVGAAPSGSGQALSLGRWRSGNQKYADCSYQTLKVTADSTVTLDLDMADGAHKASSFTCASGQTVTINKSGNDPATIVRRPFLRFDGSSDSLVGVFNESNTTGGYFFASFSVNGDSGESSGRVFNMKSSEDAAGYNSGRAFLWSLRESMTDNLAYYWAYSFRGVHTGKFDEANGVILHEVKAVDGTQFSKVNNADIQSTTLNLHQLSSEDFYIAQNPLGSGSPAIDLEALYLFDETLTDDEATQVRDYLNAKSSIY